MRADPQFPKRPTSPDFNVLALSAQQTDESVRYEDVIKATERICDYESLEYLIQNRMGMALGAFPPAIEALAKSAWMDGFAIGARYERNGGKPKPPVDINAPEAKPPTSAPFDASNPIYRNALDTLVRAVVLDVPMENIERLFGVCCGVGTVLVPAVYQSKQLPPEEIADKVCEQVVYDMQEGVRAWGS